MEKIIDFKTAKKRIISKRKQEKEKRCNWKMVVAVVLLLILAISFLSTYSLATQGTSAF